VPAVAARGAGIAAAVGLGVALLGACTSPVPSTGDGPSPPSMLPEVSGTIYFMAPDGSDAGQGTLDDPWATIVRAAEQLGPGDALLARGGRYLGQTGEGWHASGTADAPILFGAYPGETPTFDGAGVGSFLFLEDESHFRIQDLTITGYSPSGTGVIVIIGDSQGVTLERLRMSGNQRESSPGTWTEHLIYPGQGPVRDLTVRDCWLDMEGLQGGAIHVFHDPGPINLLIEGNTILNGHWGVLIDANADGVIVRDNVMRDNDLDVAVLHDGATNLTIDPDQLEGS
jgi:hypothetical protein